VGKGFAARDSHLLNQPGPSIEYPDGSAAKRGPAGFGPIASYWSPRLELAGTYDARWEQTRKPLVPLDYDERHACCAPADQRPGSYLQGGEAVELKHLNTVGLLRFSLPRLRLTCVSHFGPKQREHGCVLVTVLMEPEAHRLLMVWQSSISVRTTEVDWLDRTVVREVAP
jgi:hypothetical protein